MGSVIGQFLPGIRPDGFILSLLKWKYPRVLLSFETDRPRIALTIDDGPTIDTNEILSVLKKHGTRATWFIIGDNAQKQPEILEQIRELGHELGNHTMYDVASFRLSQQEFESQLIQVDKILNYKPGEKKWFRPGSGIPTKGILDTAERNGYRTVLGDVYPNDPASRIPTVNCDYVFRHAHPGAIIIIHDRPWTVPMLELLLPELKKKFDVVTLTELFNRH